MTNTLDAISRRIAIGYVGNKADAQTKRVALSWHDKHRKIDSSIIENPQWFRLITSKGHAACLISSDGKEWLQVIATQMDWFNTFYGGLVYDGSEEAVVCHWHEPNVSIPILTHKRRAKRVKKNGPFQVPFSINVCCPENTTVRYTLDGSVPDINSTVVKNNLITLTKPGKQIIKAIAFKDGSATGTTIVTYYVAEKLEEKNKSKRKTPPSQKK